MAHYPVRWGSDGYRPVCGLTFVFRLPASGPTTSGMATSGMGTFLVFSKSTGLVQIISSVDGEKP